MTRRWITIDTYGVTRSGPFGAWWAWIRPRRHNGIGIRHEAPPWRLRAWNVAAVVYACGATYLASRFGQLAPFLAILTGMVAATAAALWWIHATTPARYARQIRQPVPAKTPTHRHGVDISRAAMRARLAECSDLNSLGAPPVKASAERTRQAV